MTARSTITRQVLSFINIYQMNSLWHPPPPPNFHNTFPECRFNVSNAAILAEVNLIFLYFCRKIKKSFHLGNSHIKLILPDWSVVQCSRQTKCHPTQLLKEIQLRSLPGSQPGFSLLSHRNFRRRQARNSWCHGLLLQSLRGIATWCQTEALKLSRARLSLIFFTCSASCEYHVDSLNYSEKCHCLWTTLRSISTY
jgi:hypothetical protein